MKKMKNPQFGKWDPEQLENSGIFRRVRYNNKVLDFGDWKPSFIKEQNGNVEIIVGYYSTIRITKSYIGAALDPKLFE